MGRRKGWPAPGINGRGKGERAGGLTGPGLGMNTGSAKVGKVRPKEANGRTFAQLAVGGMDGTFGQLGG